MTALLERLGLTTPPPGPPDHPLAVALVDYALTTDCDTSRVTAHRVLWLVERGARHLDAWQLHVLRRAVLPHYAELREAGQVQACLTLLGSLSVLEWRSGEGRPWQELEEWAVRNTRGGFLTLLP